MAEIQTLSLAGKGLCFLESTEVFAEMTSLRRLDIRDHPEFFMTEELKEANEFKELLGIGKEDKKKVTFCEYQAKIEDILSKLKSLEELSCDEDLETYIIENRKSLGFLP